MGIRYIIKIAYQNPKYKVDFEENRDGPFYTVFYRGDQLVLRINKAHRFYKDLYLSLERPGRVALELLLFSLAKEEARSEEEVRDFYRFERNKWSISLNMLLRKLEKTEHSLIDRESARDAGIE